MASRHEDDDLSPLLTECTTIDMDIVGAVREAEQQPELISEEAYKAMSGRFIWDDRSDVLLGLWLESIGHKLMVDPDYNKELEQSVRKFVTSLLNHTHAQEYIQASAEANLNVKVLGIGSYYSHTKKSPADEFDFLCESQMRTDQLRFVHQSLPSTGTTSFTRPDFFRIYDEHDQELRAEDCRNAFQQGLKNALRRRYTDCAIECNGPTLSVILKSLGSSKVLKPPVKVAMTFGIPLDAQAEDMWPLQSSRVKFGANEDTEERIPPLQPSRL